MLENFCEFGFASACFVSPSTRARPKDSSCIFQSNRTATVLVEYTYSVGNETDSERGSGFIRLG